MVNTSISKDDIVGPVDEIDEIGPGAHQDESPIGEDLYILWPTSRCRNRQIRLSGDQSH